MSRRRRLPPSLLRQWLEFEGATRVAKPLYVAAPSATTAAVGAAVLLVLFGVVVVVSDHFATRSGTHLLLELQQLPPGTPFQEFERRFGKPLRHLTEPHQVQEFGSLLDPALLASSELYLFPHTSSFSHRYICVYRDKASGQVVAVSWKGM